MPLKFIDLWTDTEWGLFLTPERIHKVAEISGYMLEFRAWI